MIRPTRLRLRLRSGCAQRALDAVLRVRRRRCAGRSTARQVDAIARGLAGVRERAGRLFILGVGGGAGHASHAVNDFRKLCLHRELRADRQRLRAHGAHQRRRLGDRLRASGCRSRGSRRATRCWCSAWAAARASTTCRSTSCNAIERARERGAAIYGVVGAPGGTLAELADVAVVIDAPADLKTPLVESFQAVVWHALVSHPELAAARGTGRRSAAGDDSELTRRRVRRPRRGDQRAGPRPGHGRRSRRCDREDVTPDPGRRRR